MASSIERVQSKPPIERKRKAISALGVFDKPLTAPLMAALRFGNEAREYESQTRKWVETIRDAREGRAKWMPLFAEADEARRELYDELALRPVDRQTASVMIATLLGTFRSKADELVMMGMLDMLAGDEIASVSELWQPVRATPATLALACRKLIATKERFEPKAAELREAIGEARRHLRRAHDAADALCNHVLGCDAKLFVADHAEWERPYRTDYAVILPRMLDLHMLHGDGTTHDWDFRHNPAAHPFLQAVRAEQVKLHESLRLAHAAKHPTTRRPPLEPEAVKEPPQGEERRNMSGFI